MQLHNRSICTICTIQRISCNWNLVHLWYCGHGVCHEVALHFVEVDLESEFPIKRQIPDFWAILLYFQTNTSNLVLYVWVCTSWNKYCENVISSFNGILTLKNVWWCDNACCFCKWLLWKLYGIEPIDCNNTWILCQVWDSPACVQVFGRSI